MQTYLVRVYSKNPDITNGVSGIIEKVGTQQQTSFGDLSELQESLQCLIKANDCDYLQTRQIDMYGYDLISVAV